MAHSDPNLEIGSKGELIPRKLRWEPFNLHSQFYTTLGELSFSAILFIFKNSLCRIVKPPLRRFHGNIIITNLLMDKFANSGLNFFEKKFGNSIFFR